MVAYSNCEKTSHHVSIYKKAITHCHFSVKGAITYQIVQVKVNIPGKPEVKCRMLLDTGCGRAYIVQSRLSSTGGLRVPV